jgi:hypothetical protein
MSFEKSVAVAVGVFALISCGRGGEGPGAQPGTTTTSAAAPMQSAVNDLATARCDREELCNNVGAGKKYGTRDACVNEMRAKGNADLQASACPNGVDPQQLDKCLAEVRGERCGNALDTISRLTACRTSTICPK